MMPQIVRVIYFPHMWWTEDSLCNLGIAAFRLMVKEHDTLFFEIGGEIMKAPTSSK